MEAPPPLHPPNNGGGGIFLKHLSKTKILRYLKVMISKFCPAVHLILIFMKRILPHPRTIWALQVVSHFSNEYSSIVYLKSALDLVEQFFLKIMLGGHVWMGFKKISGWGIYHRWCHVGVFLECPKI